MPDIDDHLSRLPHGDYLKRRHVKSLQDNLSQDETAHYALSARWMKSSDKKTTPTRSILVLVTSDRVYILIKKVMRSNEVREIEYSEMADASLKTATVRSVKKMKICRHVDDDLTLRIEKPDKAGCSGAVGFMNDMIDEDGEAELMESNRNLDPSTVDKAWGVGEKLGDRVQKAEIGDKIQGVKDISREDVEYKKRISELRSRLGEEYTEESLRKNINEFKGSVGENIEKIKSELNIKGIPERDSVPEPPDISIDYTQVSEKEMIGSGGNANVYKITYSGETLAVKEPRRDGTLHKDVAERFVLEAETWSKLDDHRNIVSVVDYDSKPIPWIALEYMDGEYLSMGAEGMDFEGKIWTSVQIADAIHHAHTRGIAHLDLKPENILFRKTDERHYDVPKVADWGLAKMLLDRSESIEGLSPKYAAPEQFDPDTYGEVGNATDVYQLGAVLYELFTGRLPFEGDSSEVMYKILNEEPDPPSKINHRLPPDMDPVLLGALEKDKESRYDSALYIRDGLRSVV